MDSYGSTRGLNNDFCVYLPARYKLPSTFCEKFKKTEKQKGVGKYRNVERDMQGLGTH